MANALTQWQFEACIEQYPVERWVLRPADLIVGHDDLGVQSQPLPWTLLREDTCKMTQHSPGLKKLHNPVEMHDMR